MKKIVIDASVAIKWFLPEIHDDYAMRLLDYEVRFLAPDLIYAEMGSILWKRVRSKEMIPETAYNMLYDFTKMPFGITNHQPLSETAWYIATKYQRSFYDSLYLALACKENCKLVTADQALHNALKTTEFDTSLLWIEDIN